MVFSRWHRVPEGTPFGPLRFFDDGSWSLGGSRVPWSMDITNTRCGDISVTKDNRRRTLDLETSLGRVRLKHRRGAWYADRAFWTDSEDVAEASPKGYPSAKQLERASMEVAREIRELMFTSPVERRHAKDYLLSRSRPSFIGVIPSSLLVLERDASTLRREGFRFQENLPSDLTEGRIAPFIPSDRGDSMRPLRGVPEDVGELYEWNERGKQEGQEICMALLRWSRALVELSTRDLSCEDVLDWCESLQVIRDELHTIVSLSDFGFEEEKSLCTSSVLRARPEPRLVNSLFDIYEYVASHQLPKYGAHIEGSSTLSERIGLDRPPETLEDRPRPSVATPVSAVLHQSDVDYIEQSLAHGPLLETTAALLPVRDILGFPPGPAALEARLYRGLRRQGSWCLEPSPRHYSLLIPIAVLAANVTILRTIFALSNGLWRGHRRIAIADGMLRQLGQSLLESEFNVSEALFSDVVFSNHHTSRLQCQKAWEFSKDIFFFQLFHEVAHTLACHHDVRKHVGQEEFEKTFQWGAEAEADRLATHALISHALIDIVTVGEHHFESAFRQRFQSVAWALNTLFRLTDDWAVRQKDPLALDGHHPPWGWRFRFTFFHEAPRAIKRLQNMEHSGLNELQVPKGLDLEALWNDVGEAAWEEFGEAQKRFLGIDDHSLKRVHGMDPERSRQENEARLEEERKLNDDLEAVKRKVKRSLDGLSQLRIHLRKR